MKRLFVMLLALVLSLNSLEINPGNPLFLTPYIDNCLIEEARILSKLGSLPNAPNITSYSGFLTVNKTYNSNMFFWFFPAMNYNKSSPVLLWLSGGPGFSSLFGLFVENGPFVVLKDLQLNLRPYTWAKQFSVLYIDNPVGSGFSFTDSNDGYARNQNDVATNLYEAIQQFFTIFYEFRANDFYITGESYAGKYIPSLGYKLHIERANSNINLKGMSIGNGFIDPLNQLDWGHLLYTIGLLDENQMDYFLMEQKSIIELIRQNRFIEAANIGNSLFVGLNINTTSYFTNATGFTFLYNYLMSEQPEDFIYYTNYIELADTRRALHVGNQRYVNASMVVFRYLMNDLMQSVKPMVETLLDCNYKMLIYNGQLDILVGPSLTENFLLTVKWKSSREYRNANRIIWRENTKYGNVNVTGYVKKVRNLYYIIVRNAGHILAYDKPITALDMITRFINGIGFDK